MLVGADLLDEAQSLARIGAAIFEAADIAGLVHDGKRATQVRPPIFIESKSFRLCTCIHHMGKAHVVGGQCKPDAIGFRHGLGNPTFQVSYIFCACADAGDGISSVIDAQ